MLVKNFFEYLYKKILKDYKFKEQGNSFFLFVFELYKYYCGFNKESLSALEKTYEDIIGRIFQLNNIEKSETIITRIHLYTMFVEIYEECYK